MSDELIKVKVECHRCEREFDTFATWFESTSGIVYSYCPHCDEYGSNLMIEGETDD